MKLKTGHNGVWIKTNYMTWFEFWHPAKAKALEAEKELNKSIFQANENQDQLEAMMSLRLTQMENLKIIVLVVLGIVGFFLINKYA